MKKISILGSTGSIGINALEVIDHLGDAFSITALGNIAGPAQKLKTLDILFFSNIQIK